MFWVYITVGAVAVAAFVVLRKAQADPMNKPGARPAPTKKPVPAKDAAAKKKA
jgi:hypothetical protein